MKKKPKWTARRRNKHWLCIRRDGEYVIEIECWDGDGLTEKLRELVADANASEKKETP